ncbi:hypothetical protein Ddc_18006 [Ditylenchus destructor]|nr:hypothetical protein Ddc_18006 [Ditylenchus destructor]
MAGDEVTHVDDPSKIILGEVTKFENPEKINEFLSKKVVSIAVDRVYKQNYFAISYTDGTTLRVEDWIEMGLWLQHYHEPVEYVILFSLDIDKKAMDFFRGVDRKCFRGITLAFNSVFFFEAVRHTWDEELFGGSDPILRPSVIQFPSVRGFDSEYFETHFLRYDSFRLAKKIVLLDELQLDNMSNTPEVVRAHCLKISTESIIKWLHDDKGFALHAFERVFNIQAELLKDTVVDVIEKLFEAFLADTNTASYVLLIHRPSKSNIDVTSGWPTPDIHGNGENSGRSAKNPATGERMRVRLTSQDAYVEVENEKGETAPQLAMPGDDLFVERYSGDDRQSLWYHVSENKKDTSSKGKKGRFLDSDAVDVRNYIPYKTEPGSMCKIAWSICSDPILRPSVIQFGSVRGFDSEYFETHFLRYDSFRLAKKIVLLDQLQLKNMSYIPEVVRTHCLKISTESIIKWLHDDQGSVSLNASKRVFNIQVELLKDTVVDVIEKLFETFLADTNTASYVLLIHRPSKSDIDVTSGWPTPDIHGNGENSGRSAKNPATGETMRVRLTSQDAYVEAKSDVTTAQLAMPGDNLFVERYSGDDTQSFWDHNWKNKRDTSSKEKKVTPVVIHH